MIAESQRLITDAEVSQEILHRYVAIDRRDAIQPALADGSVVDPVLAADEAWCNGRSRLFWTVNGCLLSTPCIHPSGTKWNRIKSEDMLPEEFDLKSWDLG